MKTDNLSEKAHAQLRRLGYVAAAHSLPEIATGYAKLSRFTLVSISRLQYLSRTGRLQFTWKEKNRIKFRIADALEWAADHDG